MTGLAWTWPLAFEDPVWLWLLALVPVLMLASWRSLAGLDPQRRLAALLFRCLVLGLAAACLAGVQAVRRSDDLTVMFLMDRSYSAQDRQAVQEQYMDAVSEDPPADDRVGVIDFARGAYLQQLPMRGGYHIPQGRFPQMPGTDRTNIAGALRLAMAMFPHDTAKRIVLMSDGNDNLGDVLTEVRRARADGIAIDVLPLEREERNEVYFDRLIAPTYAQQGEDVRLRMVLHTNQPVDGQLRLYQNGEEMPLGQNRVRLQPGANPFIAEASVRTTGSQRYEVIFEPDQPELDTVPFNNTASAFTFVAGPSKVLLLGQDLLTDVALASALRSENIEVDHQAVDALGAFDLLKMGDYSSILLANVPAAAFTEPQLEDLASYVRDLGGGLIMLGGDEGFGAGGWIGTPIEKVMPVSFEIKHKRVIPRGALVIVMHSCEPPRGNFWGKEMAKKSLDTISSQDYLGVLAYTYSPGGVNWEVPLDLCRNKAAVRSKIDRMEIGDMPDFDTAMRLGLKGLTEGRGRDAAQKHMIIISDGDPSPPSRKLLDDFVKAKVTVSTIGIGWGSHVMQQNLRDIATKTGARFYAPRNPRELPQIFVKESKVVRRPLIVEEPFTPQVFNADSELLQGMSAQELIPPLGGMVLTSPKESPNVQLAMIRATDDGNDPVLAHWQCELGKAVAFTSGYWPSWGAMWSEWPKFSKLWAQIVRWSMRQEAPSNFESYTSVEGNRVRVVVDALDKDANYLNFVQFRRAAVVGPDHERQPLEFNQTGPGHYEAEFEIEKPGQYLASLDAYDGSGKNLGVLRTGVAVPFSPEYRALETNEALLREAVRVTGGRWLSGAAEQDDIFSHDLPPTDAKLPVWEWVLSWLILPLFLLDVAVRRLASWVAWSILAEAVLLVVLLFGVDMAHWSWWGPLLAVGLAELVGWTIRVRQIPRVFEFFTHSVAALAHTGERSTASLEHLKSTRERVKEDLEQPEEDALQRIAPPTEPAGTGRAKRRFDVGDAAAKQQAGDLDAALGGAQSAGSYQEKPRRPAPAEEGGAGDDMTSRLLRAKRRARRDMDDDKDRPAGG